MLRVVRPDVWCGGQECVEGIVINDAGVHEVRALRERIETVATGQQEGRRGDRVGGIRINGLTVEVHAGYVVAVLGRRIIRVVDVLREAQAQDRTRRVGLVLPLLLKHLVHLRTGDGARAEGVAERHLRVGLLQRDHTIAVRIEVRAEAAGVRDAEIGLIGEGLGVLVEALGHQIAQRRFCATVSARVIEEAGIGAAVGHTLDGAHLRRAQLFSVRLGVLVGLLDGGVVATIREHPILVPLVLDVVDLARGRSLLRGLIIGNGDFAKGGAVGFRLHHRSARRRRRLSVQVRVPGNHGVNVRADLGGVRRIGVVQCDDDVRLAVRRVPVLELCGYPIDRVLILRGGESLNAGGADQCRQFVGDAGNESNRHAVVRGEDVVRGQHARIHTIHGSKRVMVAGGCGLGNDAVTEVRVTLVELVVAGTGYLQAHLAEDGDGGRIVGNRGDIGGATYQVPVAHEHEVIRGGLHLIQLVFELGGILDVTVEIGDCRDGDGALVSGSRKCGRREADRTKSEQGRQAATGQGARA